MRLLSSVVIWLSYFLRDDIAYLIKHINVSSPFIKQEHIFCWHKWTPHSCYRGCIVLYESIYTCNIIRITLHNLIRIPSVLLPDITEIVELKMIFSPWISHG